MSQPAIKRTIYDDAVDIELSKWPGVTAHREVRAKHLSIVLTYQGKSRFVVYPGSPSDAARGVQNHLRDVRAALREIGAERKVEVKATTARRKRNPTTPRKLVIAERATGGPNRDPWDALKDFTAPAPVEIEEPAPAPPVGLWRRIVDKLFQWGFKING